MLRGDVVGSEMTNHNYFLVFILRYLWEKGPSRINKFLSVILKSIYYRIG